MVTPVIVAGGLGTRMKLVDDSVPKPMMKVAGKPMLEHQLLWLKESGFSKASLCLGYKAGVIQKYFGDGARLGLKLTYQIETVPRGTAGAVRDLRNSLAGDMLVVYGDLFIKMNCAPLLKFHAGHSAAATVVVMPTDHPMDSDLVALDGDKIQKIYRRKPGDSGGNLACAAVWIVRPRLLDLAPADAPSDFAKDIFPKCLAAGDALMAYQTKETLADLGTPERLAKFSQGQKS